MLLRYDNNGLRWINSRYSCSITNEKWADIDGFSMYQVSSLGNVRNVKRNNKMLKINIERYKKLNSPVIVYLVSDAGKKKGWLLNRLVLQSFNPQPDNSELFARRIDKDKYNNKLDNLEWSSSCAQYGTLSSNVAVATISQTTGEITYFASITKCAEYFNISLSSMRHRCKNRIITNGYQFMYNDKSRYINCVEDLPGEVWKLFYVTPVRKNKHCVSSFGRVKTVSPNGTERLIKTRYCCGYVKIGRNLGNHSLVVSQIVAKYHVDNPYNYKYVDYIDCNPKNNHAANLRWVKDQRMNYRNVISRKRQSESKQSKRKVEQLHLNGSFIKLWQRPVDIRDSLGFSTSNILKVCCNKRKTAHF